MRPIGSRMLRGICDAALTRPRALLLGGAAVLALARTLAVGLGDRLALSPPGAVGSESDRVDEALRSELGREPDPGMVVVTAGPEPARSAVSRVRTGGDREAPQVRDELRGLPGVASVEPAAARPGETPLLVAAADAQPGSLEARALVRRVRAQGAAAVGGVGGSDARALDADRALRHSGPLAALAAVILLLALLIRALPGLSVGRRVMLAVALGLVSLLPAAAALGLLAVAFQEGGVAGRSATIPRERRFWRWPWLRLPPWPR